MKGPKSAPRVSVEIIHSEDNPLVAMAAAYRERPDCVVPCATRGDVELLLIVATSVESFVNTTALHLGKEAGPPMMALKGSRDLLLMLRNLREGKPIETGVGR